MGEITRHAVSRIETGEVIRKRHTHYFDEVSLINGERITVLNDVAVNDSIIAAFQDAQISDLFVVKLKWNQHRVVAVRTASGVAIPEAEFRRKVRSEVKRAPLYLALLPLSFLMSYAAVGIITTPMLLRQLYRGIFSYPRKLNIKLIRQAVLDDPAS